MKKIVLPFLTILLIVNGLFAQVLVSTDPQPKNVILEEYTGIHCTYCPDGHAIAQSIADANPGRVVLINIHQGSFATPSTGEPDYRTPFGDALAGQTALTGYPSGTVNRHLFNGATTTALNRSAWGAAATSIMTEISPVNVGIESAYDAPSRTLTVTVEVYYTAGSPAPTNYLNVVLLQDSIYGPQTGGNMGNNYHHKHMLRHMITGQWGDTINNTAQGRLVTRTYTYTVPTAYNSVNCLVEDCHIGVFVSESHQEVYTGDVVYAIGGTNKFIGQFSSPAEIIKAGTTATPVVFATNAESALQTTSDFEFELENIGMPSDWSSSFEIDGISYPSGTTAAIDPLNPEPVTLSVIPGTTPALPAFRLTMRSINDPLAPEKSIMVYVIANVHDLVVNGSGGSETATFDSIYLNGLAYAGNLHHTSATARLLAPAMAASAFVDVNNIYLNIGWTFPALKDDEATAIMQFMDNGGNVMIAGQDIGWDIMSGASGSNGNAITQNFYTNYLHTGFVGDGAAANNQLTPVAGDAVFGNVGSTSIIDPYSGNMYPEELSALTNALPIFKYNNGSKIAGTRSETPVFKTVYLGIGLEMIGNKAVKNAIVKNAHDWFYGLVSVPELHPEALTGIYPNPAQASATLLLNASVQNQVLRVLSADGRMVRTEIIPSGSSSFTLDIQSLEAGFYMIQLGSDSRCFKLTVVR